MERRDLLKAALLAVSGNLLADDKKKGVTVSPSGFSESFDTPTSLPPGKLTVEYIREDIPAFQVPTAEGTRYIDTVPDTLDIAERANVKNKGAYFMTMLKERNTKPGAMPKPKPPSKFK